ncbi:unnamed protein product [Mesocestoides corti]|uniref:Uncharacterized protein n=1 Tax=Mesocestoides corti TaxID=53468 RepID=A0A0R3UJN0_MESCO|nr:unnamed protein product [Mesocestoides corti]
MESQITGIKLNKTTSVSEGMTENGEEQREGKEEPNATSSRLVDRTRLSCTPLPSNKPCQKDAMKHTTTRKSSSAVTNAKMTPPPKRNAPSQTTKSTPRSAVTTSRPKTTHQGMTISGSVYNDDDDDGDAERAVATAKTTSPPKRTPAPRNTNGEPRTAVVTPRPKPNHPDAAACVGEGNGSFGDDLGGDVCLQVSTVFCTCGDDSGAISSVISHYLSRSGGRSAVTAAKTSSSPRRTPRFNPPSIYHDLWNFCVDSIAVYSLDVGHDAVSSNASKPLQVA